MAQVKCNTVAAALTKNQITRTVDTLATLKAAISGLEQEADNLSDLLKHQGNGVYLGTLHKFLVATVIGKRLDSTLAKIYLTEDELKVCTLSTSTTSGRLYAL